MITLPDIYSDLRSDEFMSDDDVMTLVYQEEYYSDDWYFDAYSCGQDEDDDCDGQLEFEWDDDFGDDDDDDYYEDDDDHL